ncbi:MAG: hypothetical protein AB7G25_07995 [Sphingomonadaceae bacterium]
MESITTDQRFGGCPQCGRNDGYLNDRANHWFYCEAHKVCWNPASNVLSSWRDENELDWKRTRAKLQAYGVVEPLYPRRATLKLRLASDG